METNFKKENAIYYWTSFPLIDKPRHSIFLAIVTVFVAYLLWELAIVKWEQPLYYVLGVLIYLIALMPYLVPTSYYFFTNGILVQYPLVKAEKLYTAYGCFYADKNGIMLSTYKAPRRMDTFRGQSIRFSKTALERVEIIEFLSTKLKKY
jgi:hypothetical protein